MEVEKIDVDTAATEANDDVVVVVEKEEEKKNSTDKNEEEGNDTADKKGEGEAEKAKKPPTKTVDWPLRDIKDPHANDVLYGRGGGTNHHPGNKRYRKKVEDRKLDYVNSKRLDKPLVALEIIREWRAQDPPGRFLKMDEKTGLWQDVGDKKAREKTSQALREKAPLIRKQQEDDKISEERKSRGEDSDDEQIDEDQEPKPLLMRKNNVKKATLTRDHTFGQAVLEPDTAMTIDGFSWQDPFNSGEARSFSNISMRGPSERVGSQGSFNGSMPPPNPYLPPSRAGSHSSFGVPPAGYRYGDQPPATSFGSSMSTEERRRHFTSSGRFESMGSGVHPPPVPGYSYPTLSGPPPPTGGWSSRDHSLSQNPLANASVTQAAPMMSFDGRTGSGHFDGRTGSGHFDGRAGSGHFDGRTGSGHWGSQPPQPSHHPSPQHQSYQSYPPAPEQPPMYHYSGGTAYPHPPPPPPPSYPQSPHVSAGPPSPPYSVDPAVASTWSGQDPSAIAKTWSSGSSGQEDYDRFNKFAPMRSSRESSQGKTSEMLPRPDMVKRATSNQNETPETHPSLVGPSVKRAALNRDSSAAANRLKEKYIPGFVRRQAPFDDEKEMGRLRDSLEQSTLATSEVAKPKPLSDAERTSSIDHIAMDLMVKPVALSSTSRSNTIEALALDLVMDDPFSRPGAVQRETTMDKIFKELRDELPKPSAFTAGDRVSTFDFFLDSVNEPVPQDDKDKQSSFLDRDAAVANWVTGV